MFTRQQFGKPIGSFQAMQHSLASAATDVQAARLLTYNAARRKAAGDTFVKDAAMAKLFASQVAQRVSSQAVDWLGGVGFIKVLPPRSLFHRKVCELQPVVYCAGLPSREVLPRQ